VTPAMVQLAQIAAAVSARMTNLRLLVVATDGS